MPAIKRVASARSYKVRTAKHPNSLQYSLHVPAHFKEHIPEGTRFIPEWHEDGILYRQVVAHEPVEPELPAWVSS